MIQEYEEKQRKKKEKRKAKDKAKDKEDEKDKKKAEADEDSKAEKERDEKVSLGTYYSPGLLTLHEDKIYRGRSNTIINVDRPTSSLRPSQVSNELSCAVTSQASTNPFSETSIRCVLIACAMWSSQRRINSVSKIRTPYRLHQRVISSPTINPCNPERSVAGDLPESFRVK